MMGLGVNLAKVSVGIVNLNCTLQSKNHLGDVPLNMPVGGYPDWSIKVARVAPHERHPSLTWDAGLYKKEKVG